MNQIIGSWIKARPLAQVLEACEKAGVTIGPIFDMADIAADPHIQARGTLTHPLDPVSRKAIPLPEPAIRLSATPGKVRFPGLPMGAANQVVLQDLLGYRAEQIAELAREGAI